jgi:hypothetical protein
MSFKPRRMAKNNERNPIATRRECGDVVAIICVPGAGVINCFEINSTGTERTRERGAAIEIFLPKFTISL